VQGKPENDTGKKVSEKDCERSHAGEHAAVGNTVGPGVGNALEAERDLSLKSDTEWKTSIFEKPAPGVGNPFDVDTPARNTHTFHKEEQETKVRKRR
jgi:hypothetical protein